MILKNFVTSIHIFIMFCVVKYSKTVNWTYQRNPSKIQVFGGKCSQWRNVLTNAACWAVPQVRPSMRPPKLQLNYLYYYILFSIIKQTQKIKKVLINICICKLYIHQSCISNFIFQDILSFEERQAWDLSLRCLKASTGLNSALAACRQQYSYYEYISN